MSLSLYKYHSDPESLVGFDKIMNSVPEMAWEHYEDVHRELRKREHLWAESAETSLLYAVSVLEGSFPLGEDAIATVAEYSYLYALFVLKGERVEKIEDAIATDAEHSYYYAEEVIKKRFPKGEDAIATDARYSYLYAKLIDEEFPKGEDAIATDAEASYAYAHDILQKRFLKGEPIIRGSEYQEDYEQLFGIKLG